MAQAGGPLENLGGSALTPNGAGCILRAFASGVVPVVN